MSHLASFHVRPVKKKTARFVCPNMFPLRSFKPKSKDTSFLTLISVSVLGLDSSLKSITRHRSRHQTLGHKVINLLSRSTSGFKYVTVVLAAKILQTVTCYL